MPARSKPLGALKRTGLHRLDCEDECGAYVYATVAALERHGCPACACGARLVPEHHELARLVLPPDDAYVLALVAEYQRAVEAAARGQMRATGAGHRIRSMGRELRSPDTLVAERLEQQRRADARARRVSGLRRGQHAPTVHADPMPF